MYSRVVSIDTVHIKDASIMDPPIPSIKNNSHLRNAIGLAFSYEMQTVFYSDIQRGSINSVLFNGSDHAIIVESKLFLKILLQLSFYFVWFGFFMQLLYLTVIYFLVL